jgi:hypothetical protein
LPNPASSNDIVDLTGSQADSEDLYMWFVLSVRFVVRVDTPSAFRSCPKKLNFWDCVLQYI